MSRISLIVVRRARCRAAGSRASLLAKASARCKKRLVDEAVVNELEAAIAGIGGLLVRVRTYRRGQTGAGATLLDEALALGDRARRLHRHEALDPAAARALLSEAEALATRGRELLSAVRAAPEYRAAIVAHAAGDATALASALPAIFVGLEAVAGPPDLFYPVAWQRRAKPRPVADVVADVKRCLDEGFTAEGDDVAPGTDPELPAVVLHGEAPPDQPVVLRCAAAVCGQPVYRLTDTGEFLVYALRLRAPLPVLLRRNLEAEDDERAPAYPAW